MHRNSSHSSSKSILISSNLSNRMLFLNSFRIYQMITLARYALTTNCSLHRCITSNANSLFHCNSRITKFFKNGDIESAICVFKEMPFKNVVTWNCMISGYIRYGRIHDAREMFDKMPGRNIVSWTAMVSGYARCGRLDEARALFDSISKKNVVCWNSMVSGYLRNGRIMEARELFDAAPVKNCASWVVMIEGCFCHRLSAEAERLFDQCPVKSVSVYNVMLAGYAEMGNIEASCNLFMGMQERDVASWTSVISCLSRVGKMENARSLFEEMPEKDIVAWTVMIRGYLHNNQIEEAEKLFNKMLHRDIVAWNSMIGGYVQNKMFDKAFELFMKMPQRNVVSWNTILQAYVQKNDMLSAENVFQKMPHKDGTSWNIMISGYHSEEALALYAQMLQNDFTPDQVTLGSVISVCGTLAVHGWGRAIHGFIIKYAYENDAMVVSSLISMYSKCGFMNEATLVFETTIDKDTVAWNTMIIAQAYHGSAIEALELFPCMTHAGVEPDHVTFLGVLIACAHSGLVYESLDYFRSMENYWNLTPKAEHYACMIDILGRSGLLTEAYELVKQLPVNLPAYTWETLLSSCRVHENFELGDLVTQKLQSNQPLNCELSVLQSNIYAARGMWEDAANVRTSLKHRGVKKELACSWIEMKGHIYHFVYNDKSHAQMPKFYEALEGLSVLIDEFR